MTDSLYVLRVNHLHSKPMYYTTYLDHRMLLIASQNKDSMQLLQTTLTHHRDSKLTWLNRGVFCRSHKNPNKDNKHVLYITDHNNYDKKKRAFDFALRTNSSLDGFPPFDLVELCLDNPRHVNDIRRMYHFANTHLFIMDDYEYKYNEAYLSIHGMCITLPEDAADDGAPIGSTLSAFTEFLNELI